MEILSMVNLGNLYTEFRKKNFTFCFRNKFLNFWQCHNAKYLKFMCITLDLHTSNLDLHRSRVDVCSSSLDLHTSIPGLSICITMTDWSLNQKMAQTRDTEEHFLFAPKCRQEISLLMQNPKRIDLPGLLNEWIFLIQKKFLIILPRELDLCNRNALHFLL